MRYVSHAIGHRNKANRSPKVLAFVGTCLRNADVEYALCPCSIQKQTFGFYCMCGLLCKLHKRKACVSGCKKLVHGRAMMLHVIVEATPAYNIET
jgi:hypothetical protein